MLSRADVGGRIARLDIAPWVHASRRATESFAMTLPSSAQTGPRRTPGCFVIAALFVTVCVSLAFVLTAATAVQQRLALQRSVRVRAIIESTSVVALHRSRLADPQMYEPKVIYRYEWNGRSYRASNIEPLTLMTVDSPEQASAVAFAHHAGDTVTAWADPVIPTHAFLQRRALTLAVPFGLLCFLLLVVWVNIRVVKGWRRV